MSLQTPITERLYALDTLRASMMLLGLVLHSAISYSEIEHGSAWPLKDRETVSPIFDAIVGYIHAFRMPIFFVLSGYFSALLFYKKSPQVMIVNRLSRIAFPFLVFLFLLWPLVVFAVTFSRESIEGSSTPLLSAIAIFSNRSVLFPTNTMHLWFLYYLIFYSFFGWAVALLLKRLPTTTAYVQCIYEWLMKSVFWRPLWMASFTGCLLYFMDTPWAEKTGDFLPHGQSLLLYGSFYIFGWLLYKSKHLVPSLVCHAWGFFLFANILFVVRIVLWDKALPIVFMMLNALSVWYFIFGISGIFLRYTNFHSSNIRIISDASYWFYLLHLPLTFLFPGLLVGSGLSVWTKFLFVFSATTVVCWISYYYLVRSTFLGRFLNGRRFSGSQS